MRLSAIVPTTDDDPPTVDPLFRFIRLARGAAAGIATRRPTLAVACAGTLVMVNRRFYGLLLRRVRLRGAATRVGPYAVPQFIGVAGGPMGITRHLVRGRG